MSRDPLDRLESIADRVARRVEYEQGNRRGLLWVHALMGMLAGLQMLAWGSAGTIEDVVGVWIRPVMALLGTVGGLCLAAGLMSRPRSIPLEVCGLTLVGLWDLLMTIGLLTARVKQDNYEFIPLGEELPVGYIVAYPTTIYAGLFALIVIHLLTLRKLSKGGLRR